MATATAETSRASGAPECRTTGCAETSAPGTSRPKLRCVLIGPLSPVIGGQSAAFELLCRGLRELTNQHPLVVNLGSVTAPHRRKNFTFNRLREIARVLWQTNRILSDVDVLYLTSAQSRWGCARDMALIWLAAVRGKRIIAHLHGGGFDRFLATQSWLYRRLMSLSLARVERFIVLSNSLARRFEGLRGLQGKIVVVPNGIRLPPPMKAVRDRSEFRLAYLSNLIKEKGYMDVLEAGSELLARHPHVPFRLHFAGKFLPDCDGLTPEQLEADFWKVVEDRGLQTRTVYHGTLTGEEKFEFLRSSHVFVLPTYYRYEGAPLSLIEAMSCGMPVVATAHAAIPEMVTDQDGGFLVPDHRPDLIADAVKALWDDPVLYRRYSEENRRRAETSFGAEQYIGKIATLLSEPT